MLSCTNMERGFLHTWHTHICPVINSCSLPLWYLQLFSCVFGSLHFFGVDVPNSGETSDISEHWGSIKSTEAKNKNIWYKMTPLQRTILGTWHKWNTNDGIIIMENVYPKEQVLGRTIVRFREQSIYLFNRCTYLIVRIFNVFLQYTRLYLCFTQKIFFYCFWFYICIYTCLPIKCIFTNIVH